MATMRSRHGAILSLAGLVLAIISVVSLSLLSGVRERVAADGRRSGETRLQIAAESALEEARSALIEAVSGSLDRSPVVTAPRFEPGATRVLAGRMYPQMVVDPVRVGIEGWESSPGRERVLVELTVTVHAPPGCFPAELTLARSQPFVAPVLPGGILGNRTAPPPMPLRRLSP